MKKKNGIENSFDDWCTELDASFERQLSTTSSQVGDSELDWVHLMEKQRRLGRKPRGISDTGIHRPTHCKTEDTCAKGDAQTGGHTEGAALGVVGCWPSRARLTS